MLPLKVIWNPLEGIELGFFTLHFYSLSYVIAFVLGWYIIKPIFKKDGIHLDKLDPLFMYTVVGCLAGARLGHYLFYEPETFITDPLHVFLPFRISPFEWTGFAGMASHGAAIGIMIAMYFYSKKHLKKHMFYILDRIVIPTAIGGAFVRLGNLMNSEIVGKITNVDWAFKFVRDTSDPAVRDALYSTGIRDTDKAIDAVVSDPQFASLLDSIPWRHPSQIYEALGYTCLFVILMLVYWKTDKKQKVGYILGLFFVLLFVIRFFVEFVKIKQVEGGENFIFGLNTGQMLSIPFIILGLVLMFRPESWLKREV
ncbi:prolipoprotein diacylglyceryl transferase [Nonlabens antarcticus]|uniref:prolipoprotein diacylglyceryl transferase n=1 Tax=Nonlabens antarcticus TaxID=392714 RepID=UPI0018911C55|nr:prolipoprotein diacylglyceryl transferase [Nonlabens antarcticus]